MIGNTLEQQIIGLYDRDINTAYSINQIAKLLKKRYPYINKKVNQLLKAKILVKATIGHAHLCSLNLENEQTTILLTINEIKKKEIFLKKDDWKNKAEKICSCIENTSIKTVLCSNNTVFFVVGNLKDERIIRKKLRLNKMNFLTNEQFKKILLSDKSILEDHTILYAYEEYYRAIREIRGELRLRYSPLIPQY
ncbi:MAG: hypothetical protein ABIE94_05260 [archaeon]